MFSQSARLLILFGQDKEVADYARLYILAYAPGVYLMALFDLQRRFLIHMGHAKIQMAVQIVFSALHILWNYILVDKLNLGVYGTGLASFFTNFLILVANVSLTAYQKDLDDAVAVSIFDLEAFKNWKEYFEIGLPSMFIMVLDWGSYEVMTLMSGYLGVEEQAA